MKLVHKSAGPGRFGQHAQLETIALEPTSSYNLLHARGDGYALRLHYHPEIELTLILRGRGMRFVGDSILPFTEGDLCLLGPELLHSWYTGQSPQSTEVIVVQLRRDWLLGLSRSFPELRCLEHVDQACLRGLQITGADGKRIAALMMRASEQKSGSAGRVACLIEILGAIAHAKSVESLSSCPPRAPQADPALTRFQKVIDVLHRQMPAAPDQASMAELARMTPAAFSRFFRRFAGRSYVDYVNAWRIGLACRQLLQTQIPITQIAFEAGFENLSNFNRRFRQYKMMTPRQYRGLVSV